MCASPPPSGVKGPRLVLLPSRTSLLAFSRTLSLSVSAVAVAGSTTNSASLFFVALPASVRICWCLSCASRILFELDRSDMRRCNRKLAACFRASNFLAWASTPSRLRLKLSRPRSKWTAWWAVSRSKLPSFDFSNGGIGLDAASTRALCFCFLLFEKVRRKLVREIVLPLRCAWHFCSANSNPAKKPSVNVPNATPTITAGLPRPAMTVQLPVDSARAVECRQKW